VGVVWKESPTWADLIQQLFDWDDQHLYRVPFNRDRWKNLQFRLVTRHAYEQILQQLGQEAAEKWRGSLGVCGCQFFWMLPKCSGSRFASQGKKTHKDGDTKIRKNHTSWYSATHLQLVDCDDDEDLGAWDWEDQGLWNWQAGETINHIPIPFFDDLEGFDFAPATQLPWQKNQETARCDKEGQEEYQVKRIIARQELRPGVVEYQIEWEGYPSESDYTWEPSETLRQDVPRTVRAFDRAQSRNKE
jgi:hypothetical protein